MLQVVKTKDGSCSLLNQTINETYHSQNGAYSESLHVFIHAGLQEALKTKTDINILEIGLGTGLNALLTKQFVDSNHIFYIGLEPYPLPDVVWHKLMEEDKYFFRNRESFQQIHQSDFDKEILLQNNFKFLKSQQGIGQYKTEHKFHLIYHDAFSPDHAPDLWSEEIFSKLYQMMHPDGIWVSYCAKGTVKKALRESGFQVSTLPGAAGKREMTRARKL